MKHIYTIVILLSCSVPLFSQGRKLDSAELKTLSRYLLDAQTTIGTFEVPDIETPLRTMNGGYMPELDDDYIQIAIEKNIVKLNTLTTLKGDIDSMIFMKLPVPDMEGVDEMLFYSFPGTKWLMILQPCILTSASGTVTQGWLKTLPKTYADYKFITEKSAFDLVSVSHACYTMSWNREYKKPAHLIQAEQTFINDLTKIAAWLTLWQKNPGSDKSEALNKLALEMASGEGKILCHYLAR